MTYKSQTDGSPVTRAITFDLSSADEPLLLLILAHAREGRMPFEQRAIDRLSDAIRQRKTVTHEEYHDEHV